MRRSKVAIIPAKTPCVSTNWHMSHIWTLYADLCCLPQMMLSQFVQ